MRLIDADELVKGQASNHPVSIAVSVAEVKDPVHVAGGVYCSECPYFDSRGYPPADEDHPELQIGRCVKFRADVQALGFCAWGIKREKPEQTATTPQLHGDCSACKNMPHKGSYWENHGPCVGCKWLYAGMGGRDNWESAERSDT